MTAQAYGAKGYRVEAADELEDVLRQCQQNQVSCILTSIHRAGDAVRSATACTQNWIIFAVIKEQGVTS